MKELITLALIISVGLNVYLYTDAGKKITNDDGATLSLGSKPESYTSGESITQSAACTFQSEASAIYSSNSESNPEKKINYKLGRDTNPINLSFVDLDTNSPKMIGNVGQADLIKIIDNKDVYTLVEKEPFALGAVAVYTIFKETGVITWTKQYKLLENPFGLMAMGYCN